MSFIMVLVLVVRAISFYAERLMFKGVIAGVGAVVRGSRDKDVVASLSDIVLIEKCCIDRCQGFCQLLRVLAISVLRVLREALLIRSLRCEWLSVMPGIMPIDYWSGSTKVQGVQRFGVSRSCQHSCSIGTVFRFRWDQGAAKVTV